MTTQTDKLPVTEPLSDSSMDNISKQPGYADYPSMVNVYSSDNVHVGPKNIYRGNVSITHIVLPDGKSLVGGADDGSEQLDKLPEKIISNGDYVCQTQGQVFNISNGKIPTASPLIRIETRDEKTPKIFQKRFVVYASIAVCFILLSTVIYLLKFGIHAKSNDGRYSGTYNKDEYEEIYHHFVFRQSWVAQPPLKAGTRLDQPIPEVEILHTATDFCNNHNYCSTLVRNIQDYQIGSGNFDDIAYNFLVSGNGYVYEGRGWDTVSASVQGRNNFSVSIALIGTFTATAPSDPQVTALSRFIGEGVKYGRLASNYSLHAHCQWSDTKSPGAFVVDILKKMPHWNDTCNLCCTS
uniref:Peptidoglycan recognition protein n=1 Tax=Laodelphax striatellus TaxID=195883 RepID=A0A286JZ79_LAOST|nr:peptidoglycan recognition protein [Laodelphax striatellus]